MIFWFVLKLERFWILFDYFLKIIFLHGEIFEFS
jgi:hypothetical protein